MGWISRFSLLQRCDAVMLIWVQARGTLVLNDWTHFREVIWVAFPMSLSNSFLNGHSYTHLGDLFYFIRAGFGPKLRGFPWGRTKRRNLLKFAWCFSGVGNWVWPSGWVAGSHQLVMLLEGNRLSKFETGSKNLPLFLCHSRFFRCCTNIVHKMVQDGEYRVIQISRPSYCNFNSLFVCCIDSTFWIIETAYARVDHKSLTCW